MKDISSEPARAGWLDTWRFPTLVAALFFLLWASTIWWAPAVVLATYGMPECEPKGLEPASGCTCVTDAERLARYGQFGDMFGVVNSLFSGLTLAGVALTLYLQTRVKRRDSKPFLVPSISQSGFPVVVRPPKVSGGEVVIPVDVELTLTNQSSEVALNISLRAELVGHGCWSETLSLPMPSKDPQVRTVRFDLPGAKARGFVDAIVNPHGVVVLRVEATYESVERVRWRSSVEYEIGLEPLNRDGDVKLLAGAVDGTGGANAPVWEDNAKVSLAYTARPGSWLYGEDNAAAPGR